MVIFVALLVVATVALAVFVAAPRLAEARVVVETTPDRPSPFGAKMAWLAVRTRQAPPLLAALGITQAETANWRSGIATVYDGTLGETHIFVSPPVDGWTFVAGLPLPYPISRNFVDKCTPLLLALGREFADVQYFFTYPLIDAYAWARIVDGRLVRAFAISDAGVIWNKGRLTAEERCLGLKLFELRGVRDRRGDAGGEIVLYPTEEHVMRLARRWSLDPTMLDRLRSEPGLGYVAPAPNAWRPERLRKTA